MSNKIFVIGNGGVSVGTSAGHLFGGLMTGPRQYDSIHYGIDFGGEFEKVDLEGNVGKVKAKDILLIPISEEAAAACERILRHLHQLNEDGRWPFEFSAGDPPINPEFRLYRSRKNPDRQRNKAEANCVTFFNWVARACGIYLDGLHDEWNEQNRANKSSRLFNEIFNAHAQREEAKPIPHAHLECVSDDGDGGEYKALMIRHTGEGFVEASQLTSTLSNHIGGYDKLCKYMNTLQPFDCEPDKLAPYISQEFRHLDRFSAQIA